jgi:hypothetical protein
MTWWCRSMNRVMLAGVRRGSSTARPATVSFLQQAVGEHDLDDRGNRLDARPVAL